MRRRSGFTLVELLIVVATLAVLAGIIIPQFGSSVADARRSAALADVHQLTTAIEYYKMQHDGLAPDDLTGNTLAQLTERTDYDGNIGTGGAFPLGPYLASGIPPNPFNDSREVTLAPAVPPSQQELEGAVGWLYDPESGQIWAGESRNNSLF